MVSGNAGTAVRAVLRGLLPAIIGSIILSLNAFALEQSFEALEKFRSDGEALFERGDFRGAQKTWEVGHELASSAKNKQWIIYFLIKLGKVHAEMGNYGSAFDYFEAGLKECKSREDDRDRAVIYLSMSKVHAKFERFKEAMAVNQKAIDLFKGIGINEGVVLGFFNAAEFHAARKNYGLALSYLNEALQTAQKTGNKDLVAEALLNLGAVGRELGDFERSRDYCEESLKLYRSLGNRKGEARALMHLGLVHFSMGDRRSALSSFEQSLDISEALGEKVMIASNLANIGMVYKNFCDYGKAVLYYENSMRYSGETGSRNKITESYLNLGDVYRSMGYCDKALKYFTEALKNYREMGDKNGLANTLANLGMSCGEKGEYDSAMAFYEEALETKKRIGVPYQDVIGRMVDLYLEKGEFKLAEKQSRQIKDKLRSARLELYNKNFTSAAQGFEEAINENNKNRNSELLFPGYCGLGESCLGLWEYPKAREMFAEAEKIVEAQRESLSPEEKQDFFSSKIAGFRRGAPREGMVRLLMNTNDQKGAFSVSDGLKLDMFAEAVDSAYNTASASLSADDLKKEENFLLRISNIRKAMDKFFKNNRKEEYWAREKELKEAKAEHEAFLENLRKTDPEYVFIKYPKPLKPHEVVLRPEEVLVEFEVTGEVAYLFVQRGYDRRFMARTIAKTRAEMNELVNRYLKFMKRDPATGELAVFDGKFSNEVYSTLFGDAIKDVPKGATLVIVPDEALGLLPFGSLVISLPESEKIGGGKFDSPAEAVYLADKHIITYSQSAAALSFLRSNAPEQQPEYYGLTVSECVPEDAGPGRASLDGGKQLNPCKVSEPVEWWLKNRGNGYAAEKASSGGQFAREMEVALPGKTTVIAGKDAGEEKLLKLPLSKYRFITFGAKSILDSAIPWIKQPAIIVTASEGGGDYDGILTMNEIMGQNIPAEAVMLPRSEIPGAQNISGEHAMHMARAFQHAGTANVLMNLWPADEEISASCIGCFMNNLKASKEPGKAVKKIYETMKDRGYKHPYYWASFILVSR